MTAYTSFELDYKFGDDEFKTVNRLFSSFDEAWNTAKQIAGIDMDERGSMTVRIRRLDHD